MRIELDIAGVVVKKLDLSALHLLAFPHSQNLTPKYPAIVALISALTSHSRVDEAEAVFPEISCFDSLEPRVRSCNALLKAYVNANSLSSAERILAEMDRCVVAPDERTYSLLIDAYTIVLMLIDAFGKYNCLHHAMDAFDQMKSDGIEPDIVTWNTLIDGIVRQ